MHASSFENMVRCYRKYCGPGFFEQRQSVTVLDLGGADVNGSYRDIFRGPNVRFIAADLAPGPGVELVLDDPYRVPLPDASVDLVVSGQMLEHCEFFWQVFGEMARLVKPDGFIFLLVPSAGPIHRYPVDCYRFYPDSLAALAKFAGIHLVDSWLDDRGPWNDLIGVFARNPAKALQPLAPPPPDEEVVAATSGGKHPSSPENERTRGSSTYLDLLKQLHEALAPRTYVEIGVRHGASLALASCAAIGIDPAPEISGALSAETRVFRKSSDDFFAEDAATALAEGVDLGFIDGMHLFEYALRDFINLERHSHAASLLVIDDVLPSAPQQASRRRSTRVWTGDVWKLVLCLQRYRPDLVLLLVDSSPTGSLVVAGLNPENSALRARYNPLVREFKAVDATAVPTELLQRTSAIPPSDPRLASLTAVLRQGRGQSVQKVRAQLAQWGRR